MKEFHLNFLFLGFQFIYFMMLRVKYSHEMAASWSVKINTLSNSPYCHNEVLGFFPLRMHLSYVISLFKYKLFFFCLTIGLDPL